MKPRIIRVLFGAVTTCLLGGCVVHTRNVTSVPEQWLAEIVRGSRPSLSGVYELFPSKSVGDLGRGDEFNLWDLFRHAGSYSVGTREYRTVRLKEEKGAVLIELLEDHKQALGATLHFGKDITSANDGLVFVSDGKGGGESGSYHYKTVVTVYLCADRSLLVRYQEKFSNNDILFYERRSTDLWMQFRQIDPK